MKISTEPYKGVRDFYPEDMAVQNYIFGVWRKVAESMNYVEYSASLLEPADLYRSKSGDEIVNDQMFTFTDRGDREVALRPEMTPTLARMVAAQRKSLKFPLRWFSMPNLFRYEKPQRGRRREHWQLNCDLVGVAGIDGDVKIITLAYNIMKGFGAKNEDFEIRVNSRKLSDVFFLSLLKNPTEKRVAELRRLVDQVKKLEQKELIEKAEELVGNDHVILIEALLARDIHGFKNYIDIPETLEIENLQKDLLEKGIKTIFDPSIVRGFDYYTGMVFEVFDTSPENNRSLFGGGRYDNLLEIFGVEPVPTVGFGMGDITIRDFLETHGLKTSLK